ncbi:MAG: PrsW family intramembrane metalloprotease [Clostridia bacterium]|nr:PrsW family intramembrane metalloprotease [Clostridia bacterium]
MYTSVLVVAAILPAVALCIYIFKKDSAEKEPLGLLLLLLLSGILISFPVASVSEMLKKAVTEIFLPFTTKVDGGNYLDGWLFDLYNVADKFIVVAMVEEGFKWLVLLAFTRKNRHFNSLFDGIIYSVFISLGFAGFENLLYSMKYGLSAALIRTVTALAIHLFCGVSMGYYLTWYQVKKSAKEKEKRLIGIGALPQKTRTVAARRFFFMSVIMPVLAHGFYNFSYAMNKWWSTAIFCVFLAFLYGFCMGRVKRMSNGDMLNKKAVLFILYEKHNCVQKAVKEIFEYRRENDIEDHDISFDEICENISASAGREIYNEN